MSLEEMDKQLYGDQASTSLLSARYLWWLAALVCFWIAITYEGIVSSVTVWESSNTFTHCYAVLPIAAYLMYSSLPRVLVTAPYFEWRALCLILPTIFVWLFGYAGDVDAFMQIATFTLLPLFIVMAVGLNVARVIVFPLCFILFAIPIGEELIPLFQQITADLSVWMLKLFGVPIFREGLYIQIPEGKFLVAEACSGIRFFASTIMLGSLCAYMLFDSTKKRVLFMCFAVVLPIFANAVRAFGTMMIGHLTDMKHAVGVDHLVYGWIFFAFVTGILMIVAYVFRDPQKLDEENKIHRVAKEWQGAPGKAQVVCMAVLLCAILYWKYEIGDDSGAAASEITLSLPAGVESFEPDPLLTPVFPNNDAERHFYLPVSGGEAQVHVYAFAGINEGELTSWHNRLFNPDAWSLSHSHSHFLPELGANVSVLEIVSNRGVKKRVIYWNQIGNYRGASRIQSKLRQTWFKLLDVSAPGVAVAVTLPATNHSSVEALDQSLAELANSIDNMVELRAND